MTQVLEVASEKQVKFLDDLMVQKEIPAVILSVFLEQRASLSKKQASGYISMFLGFPNAVEVKKVAAGLTAEQEARQRLFAELNEALQTIPKSKYAIPVEELMLDFMKHPVHGDLVFLEVKEYMKRLQMNKLFGSVGAFTRVRPAVEDALAFVRVIQKDPYKYARKFAEHYKCCGKCGAELTDPRSRELMLGPDCRRAFGFVR
jgi:hypothetical protein